MEATYLTTPLVYINTHDFNSKCKSYNEFPDHQVIHSSFSNTNRYVFQLFTSKLQRSHIINSTLRHSIPDQIITAPSFSNSVLYFNDNLCYLHYIVHLQVSVQQYLIELLCLITFYSTLAPLLPVKITGKISVNSLLLSIKILHLNERGNLIVYKISRQGLHT